MDPRGYQVKIIQRYLSLFRENKYKFERNLIVLPQCKIHQKLKLYHKVFYHRENFIRQIFID